MHEIIAGFIACAGASAFASLLRRSARPRRRGSLSPAECGRAILALATDSVVVGQVLIGVIRKRPAGAVGSWRRIATNGSLEGTQADPAAAGRQAALTLAKSIAPNEFVVDIDECVFIVHRLADTQ